jgi:hypothetical protein
VSFLFIRFNFYAKFGLFATVRGEPVLKLVGGFGLSNGLQLFSKKV